jgi:hypothetical protein
MGVRTCLYSLMIISFSDSYVSCSCPLNSIGFSHVSYSMWSSVDKQETQTRKNNKQGK